MPQGRGGRGGGPGGQGGPGGPPPGQGGQGGPPPDLQGGDPDQMRSQMEKRRAEEQKKIEAILTPAQVTRMKEIQIQLQGNSAILDPEVQKTLGITDDQKASIAAAQEDQRDQMEANRDKMMRGELTREDMQVIMKQQQDRSNAALGKILTTDQAAKLKTMGGKAFKRQDPPADGRGPGGGGGGN